MSYGIPEIKADIRAAYDAGILQAQCPADKGPTYFGNCPETGAPTCCAIGSLYRAPDGDVAIEKPNSFNGVLKSRGLVVEEPEGTIDATYSELGVFLREVMARHDQWYHRERYIKYPKSERAGLTEIFKAQIPGLKYAFLSYIDHPEAQIAA